MTKHYKSRTIVAMHLGWDSSDVDDYRYHAGRTDIPVYAIGDHYYCASKFGKKPARYIGEKDHWQWKEVEDSYIESLEWQIWKA